MSEVTFFGTVRRMHPRKAFPLPSSDLESKVTSMRTIHRIGSLAVAMVVALVPSACTKAKSDKSASASGPAMQPERRAMSAPRKTASPARRAASPPAPKITKKADLSGLKIVLPANWYKEKASAGHWIVQSPGPSYKCTTVLLKPSAPGDPTTPDAMLARLKGDVQFLNEGFAWVGTAKTTTVDGGFLLEGRQRYRWGGDSSPAFVVVRKLSAGWMTCWAPKLASPKHKTNAIKVCNQSRVP